MNLTTRGRLARAKAVAVARRPSRGSGRRASKILWCAVGVLPAVVGLLATHLNLWHLSGVFIMTRGYFEDLRQVTGTAGCIRADPGWTLMSPSCDPWGRPYNYATLWARAFAALGLDSSTTAVVGYSFILLFGGSIAVLGLLLQRSGGWWKAVLLGVSAVSPPALFAMERGNIDVAVFAVVVAAIAASALGLASVAALLVAGAVLLKVFPLGALTILIGARRVIEPAVITAMVLVIGGVFVAPELATIASGTPQTSWQSFGVAVLPLAVMQMVDQSAEAANLARPIGLLAFVLVLAVVVVLRLVLHRGAFARHRSLVAGVARDPFASAALLGGGGSLIVAHLVGSSWDYRLIFAIPAIAGLLVVAGRRNVLATILSCVLIAQMWLSHPFSGPSPEVIGPEVWFGSAWLVTAPYLALLIAEIAITRLRRRAWDLDRTSSHAVLLPTERVGALGGRLAHRAPSKMGAGTAGRDAVAASSKTFTRRG